jgi:hypothetical protein
LVSFHERRRPVVNVTETAKRALFILVFAFALYYLITQPVNAAHVVRAVIDFIAAAFNAIARFFRALVA